MVNRTLKTSTLSVIYEISTSTGMTSKRKQNLSFVAKTSTDDDKFAIATLTGKILVSIPSSILDTEVYLLEEE